MGAQYRGKQKQGKTTLSLPWGSLLEERVREQSGKQKQKVEN